MWKQYLIEWDLNKISKLKVEYASNITKMVINEIKKQNILDKIEKTHKKYEKNKITYILSFEWFKGKWKIEEYINAKKINRIMHYRIWGNDIIFKEWCLPEFSFSSSWNNLEITFDFLKL